MLHSTGLRVTTARTAILEVFLEDPLKSWDAETVWKILMQRQIKIPHPTVYRSLSDLSRSGCLHREWHQKLAVTKAVYWLCQQEGAENYAIRLVCRVCSKAIAVNDAKLSSCLKELFALHHMAWSGQPSTLLVKCEPHCAEIPASSNDGDENLSNALQKRR